MLKAVVIDDKKHIREDIKNKINQFFKDDIEVIGEDESVIGSVALIGNLKPDLLFLDIELTDGYSFDIFKEIHSFDFKIIFITGFNHLALQAIKLGALDYVLKPIDDNEFRTAVEKAIETDNSKSLQDLIKVTTDYFNGEKIKRIVLKTTEMHHIINEDDLMYCKSEGNYTMFYTKTQGNILVSKNLKKSQELLTESKFVKCHQSFLINKFYVAKFSSDGFIVLTDNTEIPVSKRRVNFVLDKLSS